MSVAVGFTEQEMITIACGNGTPVADERITWRITAGVTKVSVFRESAKHRRQWSSRICHNGQKKGKARVEFKSGNSKAKARVKVIA